MLEGEIDEDSVPAEEIQGESVETQKESEKSETETKSEENEFSKKSRLTDLTLVVEDRHLYVNKGVIATASPVFEAMLYGEFRENQSDVIPLKDKKYEDFVAFLRCFYPHISRQNSKVTSDNIYEVLPLADKYQIEHLVNYCEATFIKLLSKNPSESSIYKIMEQACRYELSQLQEKCIEIGADIPVENLENACKKFDISKELENAVKDKFLKNLRNKYNDVFGHVKTSRTLFHCLGLLAKEQNLVEQYMKGKVTGDHKHFEMGFVRDKNHDMCIGENVIQFKLKSDWSSVIIKLTQSNPSALYGRCFVKIHNWMAGKGAKTHEIFFGDFRLVDNESSCDIKSTKHRDELENVTQGFIHDGKFSVDVFLFCISST